ncbi:MAG: class I SAM-dependent methyltransferase [Saprospiraceae bacterium]
MSHFFDYSKYYNLLYKDKNYSQEVDYIDSLIKNFSPNTSRLLDVGCGTGNHAKLMVKKGYSVHGVDLSEQMLAIANIDKSEATFSIGDIRNFKLEETFDAITSLFHVISYQTTNDDLMSSFHSVNKHLNKNGIFIFDFWYGPAVMTDLPAVRVKNMEDDSIKVIRVAEPTIDMDKCIVDVHFDVNVYDKKRNHLDHLQETHPMRFFFQNELRLIASNCGFEILNFYEWLKWNDPSTKSWYALAVCRKI